MIIHSFIQCAAKTRSSGRIGCQIPVSCRFSGKVNWYNFLFRSITSEPWTMADIPITNWYGLWFTFNGADVIDERYILPFTEKLNSIS